MAVYGINYDEGNEKDLGYKSVDISYGNLKEQKIFNSGNFVKDWYDLVKFIIMELSKTESHFIGSSSTDHFFMDGAKFDEAYLVDGIVNGETKSVLKYDGNNEEEDGILFYVPEGTQPTWAELKEMCK
jgi:hypothetical protein